jgi:putative SOS response-associated peptidase YedK
MEDWQGPHGEVMVSACILTTTPNELMAGIHDRMPVILPPAAWDLWLDPAAQPRELRGLLAPYPAEGLDAHPVGTAVGNIRNDGPELIEPLALG